MQLKNKVLITLGCVWVIFLGISYIGARYFLMKGFLELEYMRINENISRVNSAMNQTVNVLDTFALDWGHWNDAYDYAAGGHPDFVANNIETQALANYHLDFFMYLNKQGQILVGLGINSNKKTILPYQQGLEKYIYPNSPFEIHTNPQIATHGMALLPSGIMLISSVGISSNDNENHMDGTLIAGRYLTGDEVKKLSQITNIPLSIYTFNDIKNNTLLKEIFSQLITSNNNQYIDRHDKKLAYAYILLHDIFNQPIGFVKIVLSRDVIKIGSEAIGYYLVIFLLTGIILAFVLLHLMNILILKRVDYLNKRMQHISAKSDYSERVNINKHDELSSLANQFNILMDTIEKSETELKEKIELLSHSESRLEKSNIQLSNEIKDREQAQSVVSELHNKLLLAARNAGMADIITGVLHNVGNILNSIVTSVTFTRERVVNSKAEKLNKLVELLNNHKQDLAEFITQEDKGGKIVEYLSMLSRVWKDENKITLNELSALEKNINNIMSVITTQQSLSSVVSLVEEFTLTDVIEDAITLNKTSADKGGIKIDRDYQFYGKVTLDKVKLLHIIVNLIKNAIEAMNQTDNPYKMLLVRVFKCAEDRFSVDIIDNGVGISEENMKKIFTYGFTTKQNGHGFGLHASILLAKEMDGTISVSSKGEGLGATFTVELPIRQ